jgi:hypothetical protein
VSGCLFRLLFSSIRQPAILPYILPFSALPAAELPRRNSVYPSDSPRGRTKERLVGWLVTAGIRIKLWTPNTTGRRPTGGIPRPRRMRSRSGTTLYGLDHLLV